MLLATFPGVQVADEPVLPPLLAAVDPPLPAAVAPPLPFVPPLAEPDEPPLPPLPPGSLGLAAQPAANRRETNAKPP